MRKSALIKGCLEEHQNCSP